MRKLAASFSAPKAEVLAEAEGDDAKEAVAAIIKLSENHFNMTY